MLNMAQGGRDERWLIVSSRISRFPLKLKADDNRMILQRFPVGTARQW
jgi:hypothetical protein